MLLLEKDGLQRKALNYLNFIKVFNFIKLIMNTIKTKLNGVYCGFKKH